MRFDSSSPQSGDGRRGNPCCKHSDPNSATNDVEPELREVASAVEALGRKSKSEAVEGRQTASRCSALTSAEAVTPRRAAVEVGRSADARLPRRTFHLGCGSRSI
jgi:hypothetical protein